jgi:L-ascorbate metabolism protein UlaG (beta-lactamase superfamily)
MVNHIFSLPDVFITTDSAPTSSTIQFYGTSKYTGVSHNSKRKSTALMKGSKPVLHEALNEVIIILNSHAHTDSVRVAGSITLVLNTVKISHKHCKESLTSQNTKGNR